MKSNPPHHGGHRLGPRPAYPLQALNVIFFLESSPGYAHKPSSTHESAPVCCGHPSRGTTSERDMFRVCSSLQIWPAASFFVFLTFCSVFVWHRYDREHIIKANGVVICLAEHLQISKSNTCGSLPFKDV